LFDIDTLKDKLKWHARKIKYVVKRFHRRNPKLISYPAYITALIVLLFFGMSISKDIFSLPMNEIGDSLAGFAGVLAFLWIIVTVLLQNRDLKLQYEEIKDMKQASESQARSLKSAEIFKALEYIEFKFERVRPMIEECKGRIDNEIREFIESYDTGRNPSAPFEPEKDIIEIWGYFRKPDVKNELFYPFESVRDDFDYVAYLKLETIARNMKYVLDVLDALTKNADLEIKSDLSGTVETWEQLLQVHWYRKWKDYLNHLEFVVKKAIVEYKIGNEIARSAIEWSLEQEH